MNFLPRVFVVAGLVLVVALFSALIAPYFINWENFKSDFEEQASRIVGQPVKVGGATKVRFLPVPFLGFEDVEVGENADGTPLMTVERFSFNAELFPFLSGEVRIVDMTMLRPQVNLQVSENGTIAWTSAQEFPVNPEQVNIEKLAVQNGTVTIDGLARGRRFSLQNVQGELSARSILGPWKIDVDAEVEGVATNLKISTGIAQKEGGIRLKLEASRNDQPYRMLLDGPVQLENEVLSWTGDFKISPVFHDRLSGAVSLLEPLPVSAEGKFVATPGRVDVPQYRMEVGAREDPYTITGEGSANIREEIFFTAKADGRQIDLDRLKQTGEKVAGLEKRLSALRSVLERVPVPAIDGRIDMAFPAIVAGDTFIRDVSAIVQPFGSGWQLQSFAATFPGNTRLEAQGRIGLREDFGFNGKMLVASRQPSGFAAWISSDVDAGFRRLKQVGMASDVTLSVNQATFENLELRLDDAILSGKLQRISAGTGQPAIIAELKGNRINLEDIKAIYSLAQNPEDRGLTTHDLNIRIRAGLLEAIHGGQPVLATDVDSHIQVRKGAISIEKLNAGDFYGAAISSEGRIENLLSKPNGNMKLKISAGNAVELLKFSERFFKGNRVLEALQSDPELSHNTDLELELDTRAAEEGSRGLLLVSGSVGSSELNVRAAFDGLLSEPENVGFELSGSVTNPSPVVMFRQAGIETLPLDLAGDAPGPLRVDADLSGFSGGNLDLQVSMATPDSNLSAAGTMRTGDRETFSADLEVTIGSGNLAPYLLVAGAKIPDLDIGSKLPVSASFRLKREAGRMACSALSGQVAGNAFSGNLVWQSEGLARPRLTGTLDLDALDLPLVMESVLGRSGELADNLGLGGIVQTDAEANFGAPYYAGHDAKLTLSAKQVRLASGLAGSGLKTELVMLDGAVDLNNLGFELLGGDFTGSLGLKNTDGTVLGNLRYGLNNADAELFSAKSGFGKFLKGRISINGSVKASGRSEAAALSGLSGNGITVVKDGLVRGINPESLDTILLATDAEGYEFRPEEVRELVEDTVLDGGFALEQAEAPFSINRGKLAIRNLVVVSGTTRINAELEADLARDSIDAEASVTFTPGKRDRITGAEPVVTFNWKGSSARPEQLIDTGRLESYLSLRAFEKSQRRIEMLEARVIEKQRLSRQIAFAHARKQYRQRKLEEARRIEEEKRRIAEEAERLKLEAEAKRLEEERLKAEQAIERQSRKEAAEAEGQAPDEAAQGPVQLIPTDKKQTSGRGALRKNFFENRDEFLNTR